MGKRITEESIYSRLQAKFIIPCTIIRHEVNYKIYLLNKIIFVQG